MTVKEIVKEYLVATGYDGLYSDLLECGCSLDDLMPCDCNPHSCCPGYKMDDPSDEFEFLIVPKKTPDEWLEDHRFNGVKIMDPDGWDRSNFEDDWKIPLTLQEMWNKVGHSTIVFSEDLAKSMAKQYKEASL